MSKKNLRRINIPVVSRCKSSPDGVHDLSGTEITDPEGWPVKDFPECQKYKVVIKCRKCNSDLTVAVLLDKNPPDGPTEDQYLKSTQKYLSKGGK